MSLRENFVKYVLIWCWTTIILSSDALLGYFIGNERGGPWVPPPPSPWLSQGHVWTHDPVLVSFCRHSYKQWWHLVTVQISISTHRPSHRPPGNWLFINPFLSPHLQHRHPETSGRPTFADILQKLSLPDLHLLQWSEADKAVHPEASILGAKLEAATDLYTELQQSYLLDKDYETPDWVLWILYAN